MADKDEFKFDDDDTFPETDLSGAFSEGEQAAPETPDYPMTIKKSGGMRTRLLLLVLLLVIAGGGGYYYFMMMEEEPPPPTPPPKKVVASAPKPVPPPPAPAGEQAKVAVPVPPPPAAAPPAPAAPPAAVAVTAPPKQAAPAPVPTPTPAPAPAKPAVAVAPPPSPAPVPEAKAAAPAPTPAPAAKPAGPVVTGGPWLVEAGTYLNAAVLKSAEKKIRGLGYEPQVSTSQKSVRMTRLRLGTFPEGEVKEALAYARGVAPDAFAIRSGNNFTVYAGTFTNQQNIRELTQRLVSEGVKVEEEPIEVKRTISLLRFGGFDDQAAAAEAAARARKVGIAAEVIKPR